MTLRATAALVLAASITMGYAFPADAFQGPGVLPNRPAAPSCPLSRQRTDSPLVSVGRVPIKPLRGGDSDSGSEDGKGHGMSRKAIGQLELILVSLLYGSLTVTLRVLYGFDGPPMASAVSFARGLLAAACFIPPLLATKAPASGASPKRGFWAAAAELAFWNLGAQGLLNVGLLFTEASRASFLTQTSVVLTPLVAMLGGDAVGGSVLAGSGLALAGVVMLSSAESGVPLDAAAAGGGAVLGVRGGDVFCLLGALSWSLYIVRLSRFMQQGLDATRLQAWKTVILAGLYGVWCAYDAFQLAAASLPLSTLWPGIGSLAAWGVLFYSALGPGAIADVMQSNGQEKVSSSEANVILSAEPLWAAVLGVALLGERIPLLGAAGGALIVGASLLASGVLDRAKPDEPK